MAKNSLCVFLHKVGPYHNARFIAISAFYDLTVVEIRPTSLEYLWSNTDSDQPEYKLEKMHSFQETIGFLKNNSFDNYLIYGWSEVEYLFVIHHAKMHKKPVIMGSDSIQISQRFNVIKHGLKSIIAKNISGFFVAGSLSENYIRYYDSDAIICRKFDVVDNLHFALTDVCEFAKRKSLLCVVRLIEKKNITSLVSAIQLIRDDLATRGLVLRIVGSGPLENELSAQIAENKLTDIVKLEPWKTYDELPLIYAQSLCLILPSLYDETWGLVVNEAMAAGVPILASNKCGCVPDLLEDGVTGYVFDPTVTSIKDSLKTFIDNQDKHSLGVYCKERIKDYTPINHALELRELLNQIESEENSPGLIYSFTFRIIILCLHFKKFLNGIK